jgi:hypothetical protein
MVVPRKPELYKGRYNGTDKLEDWEAEIASDAEGKEVVWRSKGRGSELTLDVNSKSGTFSGDAAKQKELPGGKVYWCRCRQKGDKTSWSEWSGWHQAFKTEE